MDFFNGQHEYLLSVYGVLVWYAIMFSMSKDKYDKESKKFKFRKWWEKNNDNVFVTILFAPLTVIFDDELISLYNQSTHHRLQGVNNLVYISAGPVVSLIFMALKKLIK